MAVALSHGLTALTATTIFALRQSILKHKPLQSFLHHRRNPRRTTLSTTTTRHFSPSCSSVLQTPSYSISNFNVDPNYLSCSMPNQNQQRLKVAVLVSGGVDSSVALRLLHAAGHSCTAFYLKIWFQTLRTSGLNAPGKRI